MPRRPTNSGTLSVSEWVRAAFTPFAWLSIALFFASALAVVFQFALPGAPDAGAWNPAWSFAEVHLPGVDAPEARALAEEARSRFPGYSVEWRQADEGSWIVFAGPDDRQELLSILRDTVGERGHAPTRVGFGSNLARITKILLNDPGAIADAVNAMLPLTLFGGSFVLMLFGAALRRRLRRDSPPASRPTGSKPRAVATGVVLGLFLALCAEGLSTVMAALGHPVVEQAWVVQLSQHRGAEFYAALPMIVLVAPLAEEVFFRGYLLMALSRAWGTVGSLTLSSAAFAAVHGHGPALPVYFLYGVGLAFLARRSGTLLVPITAHITVNALGIAMLCWQLR